MPEINSYWLQSVAKRENRQLTSDLDTWATMSEERRIEAEKRHYGKVFPPIGLQRPTTSQKREKRNEHGSHDD